MNFAEINPAVNYNNLQPMNLKSNSQNNQYSEYGEYNNHSNYNKDTMSFDKYQNNMLNEKKNCNEKSSIANKHLFIEASPLSSLYFSEENIKRIQKQIRREIYKRTCGKFKVLKDADELDMQVVMNLIFDEHAKHFPDQLVRQVKILNTHTVNHIVPNAITQIHQTSKYLKQLNKPIEPMNRPLNVNKGGRKTLPSFTSVMGF